MKHLFFLLTLGCMLSAELVHGQFVEVSPVAGYMFGGSITGFEGEARSDGSLSYGGSISAEIRPLTYIEFTYLRQDTRGEIDRFQFIGTDREFDLSTSFYQLGTQREVSDGTIRPFGSVSVGFTVFNPKENGFDSATFFSMIFGGGVKAYINDSIGIKVQGRLLMPISFSTGNIYCATGGCAVAYGSYTTFVQADLSAGLVFVF